MGIVLVLGAEGFRRPALIGLASLAAASVLGLFIGGR
jgi:hypothetical protein